jgi:SPP1 gp7 family putative phage head morphogenesis protein
MKMAIVEFNFNLAPKDAMKYLQNKGFTLSFDYDELIGEAHKKAFTVAKVTKQDLLEDILTNIDAALKDGRSFKDFKKELVPTLKKKGWWGEQDIVNPKTGEVKTINIGARRLRTIYETNMRVAYQVGRYKQMKVLPISVYWRYKSALLENTRDEHANMHGMILHRDDPWWITNYPPNGWGCKCKVTAHSKKDIQKRGWKIEDDKLRNIASKDWSHEIV